MGGWAGGSLRAYAVPVPRYAFLCLCLFAVFVFVCLAEAKKTIRHRWGGTPPTSFSQQPTINICGIEFFVIHQCVAFSYVEIPNCVIYLVIRIVILWQKSHSQLMMLLMKISTMWWYAFTAAQLSINRRSIHEIIAAWNLHLVKVVHEANTCIHIQTSLLIHNVCKCINLLVDIYPMNSWIRKLFLDYYNCLIVGCMLYLFTH